MEQEKKNMLEWEEPELNPVVAGGAVGVCQTGSNPSSGRLQCTTGLAATGKCTSGGQVRL